jgi:hypothetical protein
VLLKREAPIAPPGIFYHSMISPTSLVITVIENRRDLDQAFEAVSTFQPMDKG